MGLAASQTRFLSLTARKSNVEYLGQQINQQRIILANQTSDLQSRMLTLEVPTPPGMTGSDYYHVTQEFLNPETALYTKLVGRPELVFANDWDGTGDANGNSTGDDEKGFAFMFNTRYTENGVDKDGTMYTSFTDASAINTKLTALGLSTTIPSDIASLEELSTEQKSDIQQALMALNVLDVDDSSGTQIMSVKLDLKGTQEDTSDDTKFDSDDFSFGTYLDNDLYDSALQDYEYEKQVYEKAMNDINAETEVVYQRDKRLELKLKQLDSEHKAISTELEAVKKVIDKNVETTFKTFSQ